MTDLSIYIHAAGELLRDPERRVTGRYGERADGQSVCGTDPDAVKFCLVGALERQYGSGPGFVSVRDACAIAIGWPDRHVAVAWDQTSDEGREEIVQKLLAYQGPTE